MSVSKEPTAAQKLLADSAPNLVDRTDPVLFGGVSERSELSKRSRSLACPGCADCDESSGSIVFRLHYAVQNRVKEEELIQVEPEREILCFSCFRKPP